MPRRGKRRRIARAVYEDLTGRAGLYRDERGHLRELRFPPKTPVALIRAAIDEKRKAAKGSGRLLGERGTLAEAVNRWGPLEQHLSSWRERRAELRAWVKLYGDSRMSSLDADHIRKALGIWTAKKVSAKTIRNRLWSLKHLYHILYGPKTSTPVDDVNPPAKVRHVPTYVSPVVILKVYEKLLEFEASKRLPDAKTRARFMVRAATGRRPSEIMRAEKSDVDFEQRTWRVRDGKGGWSTGIYMNEDIYLAWETFAKADAWGPFSTDSQAEVLRAAGWPDGSRPYDLRASAGIALSERGTDLADVGDWLGHKHLQTTRSAYVPILGGRMQHASERLEGRLNGWQVPTEVPTNGAGARTSPQRKRRARTPRKESSKR